MGKNSTTTTIVRTMLPGSGLYVASFGSVLERNRGTFVLGGKLLIHGGSIIQTQIIAIADSCYFLQNAL